MAMTRSGEAPGEASGDDRRPTARPQSDADLFDGGQGFAQAPMAVVLLDGDGRVRHANAAAAEIVAVLETDGEALPQALRDALAAAADGRGARIKPLSLDHAGARRYDATVIPWRRGGTCLLLAQDTTFEQLQIDRLRTAKTRADGLLGAMADGFAWETDAHGRFAFVAEPGALGHHAEALVGHDPCADAADPEAAAAVFRAHRPIGGVRLVLHEADGTAVHLSADAEPVFDAGGAWIGARGVCRDVSALAACETELQRVRQREQLLFAILRITREQTGPQAILDTAARGVLPALDAEGAAVYRRDSDGFAEVAHAGTPLPAQGIQTGLDRVDLGEREVVLGETDVDVLVLATTHHGQANGALCLWHRGGLRGWDEDERTLAAELAAQIGVANAQLSRESEWRRLSETDALTGLLNRRAFLEHLRGQVAAGASGALLFIDLDNFKRLNDTRGHGAGDQVLRAVGRMMEAHTRETDAAARLGGDEFALFLSGIDAAAARRRAQGLVRTAAEALSNESGDAGAPLGVSIGVAIVRPSGTLDAEALLEAADRAMYAAKQAGKNTVRLADTGLSASAAE
jgi:diguanylate cyclase (GGDEF)-like protein